MAVDHKPTSATRVALVSCTGILGNLIRHSLATIPDIAVVEDLMFDDPAGLGPVLREARPDAVVWLVGDETLIAEHTEIFSVGPSWAVIAVLDDGRRSGLWQLRPHRTSLGAASIDVLIDTLRDVAVRS